MPISSFSNDTVTVTYTLGDAMQIRYNWYTAPCEPVAGPLLCAVYSSTEQLPAVPFYMNVTTLAL